MAKSLQNILNDVVGEILQEDGERVVVGAAEPTIPTTARVLVTRGASPDREDEFNKMLASREENVRSNAEGSTPAQQRLAFGEDPTTGAPLPIVKEVPMSDRIGSYVTGAKDSVLNNYYAAKSAVGDWYNDLDPNVQTAVKYGVPTLGAALAAGAGALYLRKRQREANKAAGVR